MGTSRAADLAREGEHLTGERDPRIGRLVGWMLVPLATRSLAACITGFYLFSGIDRSLRVAFPIGLLPFSAVDAVGATWCAWLLFIAFVVWRTRWLKLMNTVAISYFLTAVGGLSAFLVEWSMGTDRMMVIGPFEVSRTALGPPSIGGLGVVVLGVAQLGLEFFVAVCAWRIGRELRRSAAPSAVRADRGRAILSRQAALVSIVLGLVVIGSQLVATSSGVIDRFPSLRDFVLSIDRMLPFPTGRMGRAYQGSSRQVDHFVEGARLNFAGRFEEAKRAYMRGLEPYEAPLRAGKVSPPMAYRIAWGSNNLAWLLATCPDAALREPLKALELAERAVKLMPREGTYWNTLGAARFRVRDWAGAIAAFEKSMEFRGGGDAFDWFFLAMIYQKLGQGPEARRSFDDAVQWATETRPGDPELSQLYAEAVAAGLTLQGSEPQPPAQPGRQVLRAGAAAVDVSPAKLPVLVNGGFLEAQADRVNDPLFARCLALDDGSNRLAIVVVDSCMMPRELIDRAKQLARDRTGLPTDRLLVSATHTHSAPAAMGALGSRADPDYVELLPGRIAEAVAQAVRTLAPARVGWAVADDFQHTHCRRWIYRPDKVRTDPFGGQTVRANMHPGYQNPDTVGPAGPVDPGLSVLAVQTADNRPVALLANYSMHYFGAPAVSADYFGRFARAVARKVGNTTDAPAFVAMMSQGTSGDQHWMDYAEPKQDLRIDDYADAVAGVASAAFKSVEYHDWVSLAMAETTLTLRRRVADAERLAWARPIAGTLAGRPPRNLPEVYAAEAFFLHEQPERELKLQALRVGELGIAAIPDEVFAITGLKIKAFSPLSPTFTIELANGSEGYIPPPEQHALGGYTTWPARTAGLEVTAEPRIVEAVLGLLERVAGKPRRSPAESHGAYARQVLDAAPLAYWRLGEFSGPQARDATGHRRDAAYENGVAFYLPGPPSPAFSGAAAINRAAHFAGGHLKAEVPRLGDTYSVELWFWNGLPHDARPVTGFLFSRGAEGSKSPAGDHLFLGGRQGDAGRLVFASGSQGSGIRLAGRSEVRPKTWNHVVLVRAGKKVAVYCNGRSSPEVSGEAGEAITPAAASLLIGDSHDGSASFEGKIDEVAVYDRALTPDEVARHFEASGLPSP
jgi:hypothetical protein